MHVDRFTSAMPTGASGCYFVGEAGHVMGESSDLDVDLQVSRAERGSASIAHLRPALGVTAFSYPPATRDIRYEMAVLRVSRSSDTATGSAAAWMA